MKHKTLWKITVIFGFIIFWQWMYLDLNSNFFNLDLTTFKPDDILVEPAWKQDETPLPEGDIIYFPQTGHTLQTPYLDYYREYYGLKLLGYPITEAMEHDGWPVQYFQYGRLEIHPENPAPYVVTVGWLGELSQRKTPPIGHIPAQDSLYFPETGHTIHGDFLTFFKKYGSTVQFGYPINEPTIENGLIYQDFQSARFIWQPLDSTETHILLEPLGENYFLGSTLSLTWLNSISRPLEAQVYNPPQKNLSSQISAVLTVEKTARPTIIRVIATLSSETTPLISYSPQLMWASNKIIFPPTNGAGRTHLLLDIAHLTSVDLKLYNSQGDTQLTSLAFTLKP